MFFYVIDFTSFRGGPRFDRMRNRRRSKGTKKWRRQLNEKLTGANVEFYNKRSSLTK